MELDYIDKLASEALDGYLVRKDLVRTFSRQFPVPTYVVEFLRVVTVPVPMKTRLRKVWKLFKGNYHLEQLRLGEELFKAPGQRTMQC